MLAINVTFLTGRYHATPWGRHVNEADVEWPPSPWRICRALIATWHRKVDSKAHSAEQLGRLVETLCTCQPSYRLPKAVHSHTRHYMPLGKGKTTLVFDAFAGVDTQVGLVVAWQHVTLPSRTVEFLDELLMKMSYLGRAESWVEATRIADPAGLGSIAGRVRISLMRRLVRYVVSLFI